MAVYKLLVETPLVWNLWYACLIPAYITLTFFPKSRLSPFLFSPSNNKTDSWRAGPY